jgi:hypothetical protein
MEDIIDIIVTETTNTIEITAQPNDEIIDVNIIDNREDIVLNVTPTVVEININSLTSNFGVEWGDITGTLTDQTDLNTALGLKADLVGGKVPSSQLPSYVDDVVEVANYAALPATGETGKIYVTIDTNYIYRWTGSVYVEIKDSSAVWGAITGTLSNQTDLQNALNAKQDDLNGTGFVKASGTTISYDNSTYLTTSSAASTYVPYTGATGNVDLGIHSLIATQVKASSSAGLSLNSNNGTHVANLGAGGGANITFYGGLTGTTATFTNSGSGIGLGVTLSGSTGDGIKITHSAGRAFNIQSSGSGYGVLINNETASTSAPFTIQKQGATVISMTDAGAITATSFVKTGGTSSQFLKADGSVDSSTYVKGSGTATYLASWTSTANTLTDSFISFASNITTVEGMGLSTLNGIEINGNYGGGAGGLKIKSYDETTGKAYINFINDGGVFRLGIEGSTGGGILPGSTAYATVFTSGLTAKNLEFGTNNAKRLTLDGTTGAATFTNTISATGATLTGALSGTSATFASTAYTNLTVNGTNATGWGNNIAFQSGGTDFGYIGSIGSLLGNTTKDMTIYATAGNGFRVYTNGSNKQLEISSSGAATFSSSVTATQIGIGLVSPKLGLHVKYGASAAPSTSGTNPTGIAVFNPNDGNNAIIMGAYGTAPYGNWIQSQDLGALGTNYPLILQPNGGNVGIGTTAPQLNGNAGTFTTIYNASASGWLELATGSTTDGIGGSITFNNTNIVGADKRNAQISGIRDGANNSGALTFLTWSAGSGAERMRITSDGSVRIGNTTSPGTNGGVAFYDEGNNRKTMYLSSTTTSSVPLAYFFNPNGAVGNISTSGSNTSYNTSSDYRLKQDLKSFSGLNLVNRINAYDYKWKSDNTRSFGVLAHELAEVLPYAVYGIKDGDEMQGVDYSKIVPVMVQAIKDLKAELDTLKNK